jgi:hypothetical protein
MLPDNGRELAICDAYDWNARKTVALAWRELIRRVQIRFIGRGAKANPETRLAQMIVTVQHDMGAEGTNATLTDRLEAELSASNDGELRKLFAKYLSEP